MLQLGIIKKSLNLYKIQGLAMKKVQFYFDFLSPFSYFAWLKHREFFAQSPDLELVYRPVLMGKLFSHHDFPGPGQIPVKRDYELKKCFRYAYKQQVKFHPPATFPFNPLAIIRMATLHASGENQYKIISEIYDLVWGEGKILEDPDLILKIFTEKNIDPDCIERSFEKEAKLELKTNIKDALGHNIFGVPSFVIDNEYFWGNDCWEDLGNYLMNNDNYDKDLYNELTN